MKRSYVEICERVWFIVVVDHEDDLDESAILDEAWEMHNRGDSTEDESEFIKAQIYEQDDIEDDDAEN